MVLALLKPIARLWNWLRKRITKHRTPSSPQPHPTVSALDPDLITRDLRDPHRRQLYIDHLEACLTMPAPHRTR